MNESQFLGMQQDSVGFVVCQFSKTSCLPLAVCFVANEGMADELEMDANLMRTARVKSSLHQGCFTKPLQNAIARVR